MSEQTARRLAWSIALVSIALVTTGLAMSILAQIADDGHLGPFSHQFFTPVVTIAYGVVGALVAARHPRNPIGWIFCATAFLSALNMLSAGYSLYSELAMTSGSLPGAEFAQWLELWVWIPNVLLPITFLLLLFPDGTLLSTRWRPIAWAAGLGSAVLTLSIAFHPGPLEAIGMHESNPFGISGNADVINAVMAVAAPFLLAGVLGSVASVVVRFRNAAGTERAQLKWLAFAGMIVVAGNILGGILWLVWGDNPITEELYIVVTDVTIVNIVIATGIAILRYRLWDIDILINRTLVYGALTASVVGLYVIVVGSLSAVFQAQENAGIALLATGLVAVLFQPLRDRLQRAVNRLLYGERDDPYAVLERLVERLEVAVAPTAVLPTIVETIAQALKLPYVAIALRNTEGFKVAASYGEATLVDGPQKGACEILPLSYQSEMVGRLILAPRAPGEDFAPQDRRLLENIARQAGIVVHSVRLTHDLQRSRERLVSAREQERQRLRRDLHDGLGPILGAITLELDAVRNLLSQDLSAADDLLARLKRDVQSALTDIRRIAYGLRPPALDELGLISALQEHITTISHPDGLQIRLEAPPELPVLSAAVEVAVYRIALEAMTNVSNHAHARRCTVRLNCLQDRLCLEVIDDGRGLPVERRNGVGLASMRERAEELGGTCVVGRRPEGGTSVFVQLPCEVG